MAQKLNAELTVRFHIDDHVITLPLQKVLDLLSVKVEITEIETQIKEILSRG